MTILVPLDINPGVLYNDVVHGRCLLSVCIAKGPLARPKARGLCFAQKGQMNDQAS